MSITRQESPAPKITQRDLEARSPASQGLITQFAIVGLACSGLLTSTTATPPAASAPAIVRSMRDQAPWSGNGLSIDDLRGLGLSVVSAAVVSAPVPPTSISQAATPAAQLRHLRDASGLTGEQMARLFGVSRRAVHLWASGGRMNAAHHERLARLLAITSQLPGRTPEQRRTALLAPGQDGLSLFDRLRSEYASGDDDVSGAPWRPADLLRDSQEPKDT
jgi:transcriptional regulator with XRE-family HTH domain